MNKKVYEAPMARDLSSIKANGGLFTESLADPLGICMSGSSVSGAECTVGTSVGGAGDCSPNGFQYGVIPYCSGGSGGMSGCVSGTYAST